MNITFTGLNSLKAPPGTGKRAGSALEERTNKNQSRIVRQPGLKGLAYTPAGAGAKHRERC